MKKAIRKTADPEMRAEYDFSRGVRANMPPPCSGTNVVWCCKPDVRGSSQTRAVNESFAALAGIHSQAENPGLEVSSRASFALPMHHRSRVNLKNVTNS